MLVISFCLLGMELMALAKEYRSLLEDEKPRFLSELRAMIPSAREAQEKTPKFLVVALEGSKEDIGTIMNLISMVRRSMLCAAYR